jgi:hypothetical protein
MTFNLYPGDLLRKHGFDDGDLFFDWLLDSGYSDDYDRPLLRLVVERCVVPMLSPTPDVCYDSSDLHNPCRVPDGTTWAGPSVVEVDEDIVRALLLELMERGLPQKADGDYE